MGPDAMIFVFWILRFKPAFSLSSFTFIQRLSRLFGSSLSAIRVVSSVYLRLLIFLLAILIPAYASSSPAFLMMYPACKLNKQGDNIQPWCTPFPIWNQSVVPCPVLTVAYINNYKWSITLKNCKSLSCMSEALWHCTSTIPLEKSQYPGSTDAGSEQVCHPHPMRAGVQESGRNGHKLTQVS